VYMKACIDESKHVCALQSRCHVTKRDKSMRRCILEKHGSTSPMGQGI
jgi:hypothetical protein